MSLEDVPPTPEPREEVIQRTLSQDLYRAISRLLDTLTRRSAALPGQTQSLAKLSRRAKICARAKGAGAELFAMPFNHNLTLPNDAVRLGIEQYMGLPLQATEALRTCTCKKGDYPLPLSDPARSHHALGCVRANPGKRAHWLAQRHAVSFLRKHTELDVALEPRA